jgi:hypothetical protein
MFNQVLAVVRRRSPDEIAQRVVGRVAIQVATLVALWAWPTECRRDEAVDGEMGLAPILGEPDRRVPRWMDVTAEDATLRARTRKTAYAASI